MGLVKWKHKAVDGAICEAEFPLADLVEFKLVDVEGDPQFKSRAHFLHEWEQLTPELPPTDPVNLDEDESEPK